MRRKLNALSQRYVAALKKHLRQGPGASPESARGLGHRAVTIGLETLDMARIHDRALATLEASSSRDGIIRRAGRFFAEAITPIEELHRAALETNVRLNRLNKALAQRTGELASAKRSLKQGVARRKTVEEAARKSGDNFNRLLKQSHRLQERLRHLAHQVLTAQENNRTELSHGLQDQIAQTLLGINTRLVSVERAAGLSDRRFQKEIASTRRLVNKSDREINQFVREFGSHRQT